MSSLSDASYKDFLDERISRLQDGTIRDHVREKFNLWSQQYRATRIIERAIELLASERERPSMLYLRCEVDLQLLGLLARQHHFDARVFRGFLVADPLWDSLQSEWFAPFPVHRIGQWQDTENTVVVTLSDTSPFRNNGADRGNDYQDRFIDLARLSALTGIRQRFGDRRLVLYVDYRKSKTLEALAEAVSDQYTTVGLVTDSKSDNSGYDHVIREPNFYLWPLVFKHLAPDVFHINVGRGTQGVPFLSLVPDPDKAVVDFYDTLTFTPDEDLDANHTEPRQLTRASESYLWTSGRHFIHRSGGPVTRDLQREYARDDVASVIEYVKDPVYSQPSVKTGDLNLVYGGIIIQDAADVDSVYYRRFRSMVDFFAKDNLHLHIYQSPYLYGFGRPKAVEELARTQGLTNVHGCEAMEEDDWIRDIARHDYGIFIFGDTRPSLYPHILPFKFIAYLRAGLPVIVPEDQTLMADLVNENGIGVVYRYEDCDRMSEILSSQDINVLKENVARFRSTLSVAKGGEKVAAMYGRILNEGIESSKTTVPIEKPEADRQAIVPQTTTTPGPVLALQGRAFLSEPEYTQYLDARIEQAGPDIDTEYVRKRFQDWSQIYHVERMRQRAEEVLAQLQGKPFSLYIDGVLSLQAAAQILEGASSKGLVGFKGLVVEDEFLAAQDARIFGSVPVVPRSRAGEVGTVIFSLSGSVPGDNRGSYQANDYREKFIDLRRFDRARQIRQSFEGHDVILYPLYREIHTVCIMAKFVRQQDERLRSLSLCPKPLIHEDFDAGLVEPFFYLWPLLFQIVDPSLVHMNVGWGIQALAMSPFMPDRQRTVIDFYEVLSFLPDAYFEKTHSNADEVRSAEEYFVRNYDHIMHLCADTVTTKLMQKYDHRGAIVSVTEYLEEPTYNVPPRNDGEIRLVYGGCMLATTDPDDLYYKAFVKVAPHFARENLHLYIYNSPYAQGWAENHGLKDVIQKLHLSNAHACTPLKLDAFVKEISGYDYGVTLLRPKDMEAVEYNYFMATKVLTYLRAGLPIVIDADNRFMAGLVNRYNIGIVLQEYDLENLPDIVNNADLPSLKRNVVKFRNEFSIEKGGAKVLGMYREMLDQGNRRCVSPTGSGTTVTPRKAQKADPKIDFEKLIESMASAENRLYYRDQSSRTLSSLVARAQECDPTVVVELGTLAGLSLRAWIAATEKAKVFAVDLSFKKLKETLDSMPVDLARVTLVERDILKVDFTTMWTPQDRVVFFVDAHDLPNVPIMEHVLTTALPSLPDGSTVVVDDLWYSEERLTSENAASFLEGRVCGEIDELQCFHGHYAPYHEGGSFMGFAEVIPLLEFVNRHGIVLEYDRKGKHAFFTWKKEYLSHNHAERNTAGDAEYCGSVWHNPLTLVPVSSSRIETMRRLAADYQKGNIREVAEALYELAAQYPDDEGLLYGLAVCMARGGMLRQARDVFGHPSKDAHHPRYQRLLDDLSQRVGSSGSAQVETPEQSSDGCGMTMFAMPKPFVGHIGTIQRNAIRSWVRLDPTPEIILFGDEPGTREMAAEVGACHIPDVVCNEFGTPLVNELFGAAQDRASHDIVAYVNADMILFQDFIGGVQRTQAGLASFLLIGQRWDLPLLDEIDFDKSDWQESLQREMQEHAMLHAECGLDYFVFPKGVYLEIPPFAIGRTAWDNWLVMAPHKRGIPVVDGTEFITAVHQDHDYGHMAGGRHEAWNGIEAARNRTLAESTDNSGRTSGATRVLRKDGTLVEMEPRQPWYLTATYRDQRSAWLLKQAVRLRAAGREALAACKLEEALTLLEALLALRQLGYVRPESMDAVRVAERYVVACTSLAECYLKLGRHGQVVQTYTRLLDNPSIRIPEAQRASIERMRDQLRRSSPGAGQSVDSSAARNNQGVAPQVNGIPGGKPSSVSPLSTSTPALQATASDKPGVHDQHHQGLAELERKFRLMPDGTRAKRAAAVRLSDLYRRAGLSDKSQALAREAASMKAENSGDAILPSPAATEAALPRVKVTVITACRNSAPYLRECLDSILKQTMSAWQLFLLDDGSTDDTRRIIEEYARRDARIKAWCFDDSVGPYIRRNFAIERADADFIVIQDADDIMCPDKLERLYEAMMQDGRLGIVGSFYRKFLDEFRGVKYTEDVGLATEHEQILVAYQTQLVWDFSWHGSAIIRRDLFNEVGPYDENPFGADSFWLAKVAEYARHTDKIRLRNIPEFLTLRRVHSDSQTGVLPPLDPRGRRAKYWQQCLRQLRQVAERAPDDPQFDIARELRACTCGEFLTRFKAQLIAWESESLDGRVVAGFLQNSVKLFNQGYYVSCANILNSVEAFDAGLRNRVVGYELLRGLAYFAVEMRERSLMHIEREIQLHDSPAARQFRQDAFDPPASVDVQQWCQENAERYNLGLTEAERAASSSTASCVGATQKQDAGL